MRFVGSIDDVLTLPEGKTGITLDGSGLVWGDMLNPPGMALLCRLAASGYSPVFEFGTFRGNTAYKIAQNLESGVVVTLDIPTDDSMSNIEQASYGDYTVIEIAKSCPRIEFLSGNSLTFDFVPHLNRYGLVFVDGGHSYEVCKHDSEAALKIARPNGVVLWDDYGDYWPGVRQALNELAKRVSLVYLQKERVVIHIVPAKT